MSADVGKTYRMLQEAHSLLKKGTELKIGHIETHFRKERHELFDGLPVIPRRHIFYKRKNLEEMDHEIIINLRPEIVIVTSWHIPAMKAAKTRSAGKMF